jgi:hypothetical protein
MGFRQIDMSGEIFLAVPLLLESGQGACLTRSAQLVRRALHRDGMTGWVRD